MTFFEKENETFAAFNCKMFAGLAVSSIAILQETNKGVSVVTIPTTFVGKEETKTTTKLVENLLKTFVAELTANESCKLDDDYTKDFVSLAKFYAGLNKGTAVLQVVNETEAKVIFTSPVGTYLNKVFPKKNTLVEIASLASGAKRAKLHILALETISRFEYDAKVVKFFTDMTAEFAQVDAKEKELQEKRNVIANLLSNLNKEIKELKTKATAEKDNTKKQALAKELKDKVTLKEQKEKELQALAS